MPTIEVDIRLSSTPRLGGVANFAEALRELVTALGGTAEVTLRAGRTRMVV